MGFNIIPTENDKMNSTFLVYIVFSPASNTIAPSSFFPTISGPTRSLTPAPGKRQFVNKVPGRVGGDDANQMMLLSDMILKWDPSFRGYLELYAEDEALLNKEFGEAFKKLTELGCGF